MLWILDPPPITFHSFLRGQILVTISEMMRIEGEVREECIEWRAGHKSIVTARLAPICQIINWQHNATNAVISQEIRPLFPTQRVSREKHAHFNAIMQYLKQSIKE